MRLQTYLMSLCVQCYCSPSPDAMIDSLWWRFSCEKCLIEILVLFCPLYVLISDWCLVSVIHSNFRKTLRNCFLYAHNMSIFENISSVVTLFKIFAWAEYFESRKNRLCRTKTSSFRNYNCNLKRSCFAIHRISSAYLQITTFKISPGSVKRNGHQKYRCW